MEAFYDGDLKDIWDSDLDPTDSLKLSSDTDMQDWFLERDVKMNTVILNDKLISDALFNGTLPIKSEHSYSLNSDGDSLPDSPRSLQPKMDDIDDDYYPAISLKSAINNNRRLHTATIDPNCLTIATTSTGSTSASATCSTIAAASLTTPTLCSLSTANPMLTATSTATLLCGNNNNNNNSHCTLSNGNNIYAGLNKIASAPMTFNLRTLTTTSGGGSSSSSINNNNTCNSNININNNSTSKSISKQLQLQLQLQQQQLQLQQQHLQQQQQQQHQQQNQHQVLAFTAIADSNVCSSPATSRDGSISPDICSDIEIDESYIKDEPMSPSSSCPPSPNTSGGTLSLNMANVAAFTNSDLVFEHKNGSLQLTPASQSLLKSQQFIMSSTANVQSIVIPKVNIKTESMITNSGTTMVTAAPNANSNGSSFGLPPTPPSSMPSDESEGNQSPEHLLSPLSPPTGNTNNTCVSASATAVNNNGHSNISTTTSASATSARRSTSSSSSSSSSHSNSPASSTSHAAARNFSGSSTRQPIHTPLISSQPKGSTGTLYLTEEEKRTLLAEGYPIPQRLPLTKAEEKSLKKIRRKIKNKISAQESRRKKKEYMDQLERKVEILVNENIDYKKRVESLEDSNASLLSQLQKLQALVNKQQQNAKKT